MDSDMPDFLLQRRHFSACALTLAASGFTPLLSQAASKGSILVVGDSISAEYGLPRGSGWVTLLEQRLVNSALPWSVVNASISGDTTAGGRSRLAALLAQHRPKVLIIELGANDALRGLPMNATQDNLLAMTRMAQAQGAAVLLLGMQMPPNYGPVLMKAFEQVFVNVARQTKALRVPFLLKGIADAPEPFALFQSDRIHPNVQAQSIMLDNVWPELKKLLK
jgi:acyl-CoA thioesterase-1